MNIIHADAWHVETALYANFSFLIFLEAQVRMRG